MSRQTISDSLAEQIVAAIERAMQRQGVSPSDLARRAQVGRPYLYRVLAREQTPGLDWIERVAAALELTVTVKVT